MLNKWLGISRNDVSLFKDIFGKDLKDYFEGIYGFDIIKFDEDFFPDSKDSVGNNLLEKYGEEAYNLVKSLVY